MKKSYWEGNKTQHLPLYKALLKMMSFFSLSVGYVGCLEGNSIHGWWVPPKKLFLHDNLIAWSCCISKDCVIDVRYAMGVFNCSCWVYYATQLCWMISCGDLIQVFGLLTSETHTGLEVNKTWLHLFTVVLSESVSMCAKFLSPYSRREDR